MSFFDSAGGFLLIRMFLILIVHIGDDRHDEAQNADDCASDGCHSQVPSDHATTRIYAFVACSIRMKPVFSAFGKGHNTEL